MQAHIRYLLRGVYVQASWQSHTQLPHMLWFYTIFTFYILDIKCMMKLMVLITLHVPLQPWQLHQ